MPWLWRRLVAAALILPVAWELPYAMSVALKKAKPKQNKKQKKTKPPPKNPNMYSLGGLCSDEACIPKITTFALVLLYGYIHVCLWIVQPSPPPKGQQFFIMGDFYVTGN